ncbi:hypothetical protein E3P99_00551 [Wallemia hederae]|uniref:CobW/HypB/UreG nucleotide-binding domain-containing protein n=1 Tax=Wallemia hederae TaxID=1540922 RepID=A0A4T0FV13_9BASI|nr:hypothetical protein E3P99_00551 [Wallemia hederae]
MAGDSDYDTEIPELIEASDSADQSKRVPLTILTGYLGAGKSTLISHILTKKHGHRIAVIVNEFGDTADIERRAVNVGDQEELLELDNGCLCCSIRDAGVAAIAKMMRRKGKFDYIVLETTGLADPSGLAEMFWENELYIPDIYLDGVVCVVDAKNVLEQLDSDSRRSANECVRQIASADSVIINKQDLVSESALAEVRDALNAINATAAVHLTTYGVLDLSQVINLNAYNSVSKEVKSNSSGNHDKHNHDDNHSHSHSNTHLFGISSVQVPLPMLTQEQYGTLDKWLRSVLWESTLPCVSTSSADMEILRSKGVVSVQGVVYILQGVRDMYELKAAPAEQTQTQAQTQIHKGKIVIIGKNVDEALFTSSLTRFLGI